jgi:hypothetical protein
MGTITTTGFSNLMAGPLSEENEHSLVMFLIHNLNVPCVTGLCEDPMVGRFADEEVFFVEETLKQPLLLLGASNEEQANQARWEIMQALQTWLLYH